MHWRGGMPRSALTVTGAASCSAALCGVGADLHHNNRLAVRCAHLKSLCALIKAMLLASPFASTCNCACTQWRSTCFRLDYPPHHTLLCLLLQRGELLRKQARLRTLRAALRGWQSHLEHGHRKATAIIFAATRLQLTALTVWRAHCQSARGRHAAAGDLAARVAVRSHGQLTRAILTGWLACATQRRAARVLAVRRSAAMLRRCLLEWRGHSRRLGAAARLLRRLLSSTLQGAFQEWRAVARERAHWRRTQAALVAALSADGHLRRAAFVRSAAVRWASWPLQPAFAAWVDAAHDATRERNDNVCADVFRASALCLKALTGFRWAVRAAAVSNSAARHARATVQRSTLRGWLRTAHDQQVRQLGRTLAAFGVLRYRPHFVSISCTINCQSSAASLPEAWARYSTCCALYVHSQEKRRKTIAAVYSSCLRLQRTALRAWVMHTRRAAAAANAADAADAQFRRHRGAACLRRWRATAAYLGPLRHTSAAVQNRVCWQTHAHTSTASSSAVCLHLQCLAHSVHLAPQTCLPPSCVSGTTIVQREKRRAAQVLQVWAMQCRRRRILQHALARMLQARLAAAFGGWCAAVHERRRRRQLLMAAVSRLKQLLLSRALAGWRAAAARRAALRASAQRVLGCMMHRQLARAWRGWHEGAVRAAHKRQALGLASRHHAHICGRQTLNAWRQELQVWQHTDDCLYDSVVLSVKVFLLLPQARCSLPTFPAFDQFERIPCL